MPGYKRTGAQHGARRMDAARTKVISSKIKVNASDIKIVAEYASSRHKRGKIPVVVVYTEGLQEQNNKDRVVLHTNFGARGARPGFAGKIAARFSITKPAGTKVEDIIPLLQQKLGDDYRIQTVKVKTFIDELPGGRVGARVLRTRIMKLAGLAGDPTGGLPHITEEPEESSLSGDSTGGLP